MRTELEAFLPLAGPVDSQDTNRDRVEVNDSSRSGGLHVAERGLVTNGRDRLADGEPRLIQVDVDPAEPAELGPTKPCQPDVTSAVLQHNRSGESDRRGDPDRLARDRVELRIACGTALVSISTGYSNRRRRNRAGALRLRRTLERDAIRSSGGSSRDMRRGPSHHGDTRHPVTTRDRRLTPRRASTLSRCRTSTARGRR